MVRRPKTKCQRLKTFLLLISCFLVFSLKGEADNMERITLPKPKLKSNFSVEEAILKRRSVRAYSPAKLTTGQISQLLWACQGITDTRGLRAAPSAGALYPLEIYLLTDDGVYRYIPESHELEKKSDKNLKKNLSSASWNQRFVEEAPIDIVICAVYERVTSRYGKRGIKYVDIEVGHAAENLHLQAVSLGLVSRPIGAFNDESISRILNLSDNEKPVYIIPVGNRR